MSYGKLNIWIRFLDCSLVTDQWRTDLVIKSCGGVPLVDMDPTVIEKLKARYPDYATVEVPDGLYHNERRIRLKPGGGKHFNHIEVDVPPGCYVIWTRVCHGGNDETNKVMVNIRCGEDVCVNLLLNMVETCSREVLHPLLIRGIELGLAKKDLKLAAGAIMAVAEKSKKEFLMELDQKIKEAEERKDRRLQKTVITIKEMVKDLPYRRD